MGTPPPPPPPPPPHFYINLPFSGLSPFLAKFVVPPRWCNFLKALLPL